MTAIFDAATGAWVGEGEPDDLAFRMVASRLLGGTPAGLGLDVCWPWQGTSTTDGGYGMILYTTDRQRHAITAPRAMLALKRLVPFVGRRWWATQTCKHPWCVNPLHVVRGDEADLGARQRGVKRSEHTRVRQLTDEAVRAIRSDSRPLVVVADEFGTSMSNVSRIRNGRRKAGVV